MEEFILKNKNYNKICFNFAQILKQDHSKNKYMEKITSKILELPEYRTIENSFNMFNITCNEKDTIMGKLGSLLSSYYMNLNSHHWSIYDQSYRMDKKRQKIEVKYETLQEEELQEEELHREINKDDVLQEKIRQLTQDIITIITTVESQLMDSTQHVKFNIDKCIQNQTKIIENIEKILEYQIELPKTYEKFKKYYEFLLEKNIPILVQL